VARFISDVTELVRTVLRNPDIELDESTRFEELPGWDSMHLVSVVVEAEVRFGLMFEAHEVEPLLTAGDLCQLIADRLALARA
jgi:acyl carrier protein